MKAETDCLIFSGSSHPHLAKQVAACMGQPLGKCLLETFPDGEIHIQILDNVRGRDVFVMQSVAGKPNTYLMELLIMIDALKRASARSITAVIPYFGYSRQDRKDKPRVAITAKLVANLLQEAGAARVLTMDLHADQVQGFFDIPVDNLYARPVLLHAIQQEKRQNLVVVTPDLGSIKIARAYSAKLHTDLAIVNKRRTSAETVDMSTIIGSVEGCDVLLVDDICSTGGTLVKAAELCKKHDARRIYAATAHGLFVGNALEKIIQSPIEKLFVTNTIPGTVALDHPKIQVVSAARLFCAAMQCVIKAQSISSLFEMSDLDMLCLDQEEAGCAVPAIAEEA